MLSHSLILFSNSSKLEKKRTAGVVARIISLGHRSRKAIRSSKRRFAEDHLNNEKNVKQWWDTVKILTNNCKNNKKIKDFSVIDNERQSNDQLAKNLNYYYKGVGGDAVPSNDVLHHSNSSPLQPLSIGKSSFY